MSADNEKRAEGFWWVKTVLFPNDPWTIGEVTEGGAEIEFSFGKYNTDSVSEWGPFVGEQPGDGERIIHEMTQEHALRIKALQLAVDAIMDPTSSG